VRRGQHSDRTVALDELSDDRKGEPGEVPSRVANGREREGDQGGQGFGQDE